jgi:hypothetical protein
MRIVIEFSFGINNFVRTHATTKGLASAVFFCKSWVQQSEFLAVPALALCDCFGSPKTPGLSAWIAAMRSRLILRSELIWETDDAEGHRQMVQSY